MTFPFSHGRRCIVAIFIIFSFPAQHQEHDLCCLLRHVGWDILVALSLLRLRYSSRYSMRYTPSRCYAAHDCIAMIWYEKKMFALWWV